MMQRALQFRKRLIEAGIFLVLLLLAGVFVGVRTASQTHTMIGWVAHAQKVLSEAATVRLCRMRLHNYLWAYRASPRADLLDRYRAERTRLTESIVQLRFLTADNPGQNGLLREADETIQAQLVALDQALDEAQAAAKSGKPQNMKPISFPDSRIQGLLDQFENTERNLFLQRTEVVEKNARWTLVILLVTGTLGCAGLMISGHYIQREILARAKIEAGLMKARELMGTELDQQRAELGHTMEDLHLQIAARNRAEEAMKRLNAELEERVAERTRELEETNHELESFNYSVSHDLRAPLRHMDGFSKILEEEAGPQLSEEARQHLQRIRRAAAQMSVLVDDLMELSRLGRQEVKRRRVSLREMVEQLKKEYSEAEGKREIVWRIGELPEVEADPGLLRQVFTNLISNALKFTKYRNPAVVEIAGKDEGTWATVFVKDNGAGFDPHYADKLFGVFQRLHRQDEFEGTGIGLAIVSRIVQKHGGKVWAESKPDYGATFYLTLKQSGMHRRIETESIGAKA
ncbi:MAG: CHASE3 domain-containing protein [Acidobacteria bacterium]|nr:CHASE3 domain-containing protein [Acidobacteriota bacterium]MBS1864404.1 CHASE3 domain-containing protein [Acidobacteriota bacterium]